MTPKERAAMQQALEALEETTALCINYESVEEKDGYQFTEAPDVISQGEKAITDLREALAEQAEQEPVAWFKHGPYDEGEELVCVFTDPHDDVCYSPLYAQPVRTKDLTDDEIWEVVKNCPVDNRIEAAKAGIAADRELNK